MQPINNTHIGLEIPNLGYFSQLFVGGVEITGNGGGVVGQIVTVQTSNVGGGTTLIPYDGSIPQITEGDPYLTPLLITPNDANSLLLFNVSLSLAHSTANTNLIAAVFKDAEANAIGAGSNISSASVNTALRLNFSFIILATQTTQISFSLRAGASGAGTTTLNGVSVSQRLGGVNYSIMQVTEILP